MLYLDLKAGDTLLIDNGRIAVTLEKSKGANKFRFGIEAPKSVPVSVQSKVKKINPFLSGLNKNIVKVA